MGEICQVCGLPKEICTCEELEKEEQKIKIRTQHIRGRKFMTIIEGFDPSFNLEDLAKDLKQELACGGTAKNNRIELQGTHKQKVKGLLLKKGFKENQIDVY